MAIALHHDRGWPIWHTRKSDYFAAHNSALYRDENGELVKPQYSDFDLDATDLDKDVTPTGTLELEFEQGAFPPAPPATNWIRLAFDCGVAAIITIFVAISTEWLFRRLGTRRNKAQLVK